MGGSSYSGGTTIEGASLVRREYMAALEDLPSTLSAMYVGLLYTTK